jgi:hypothetical protein
MNTKYICTNEVKYSYLNNLYSNTYRILAKYWPHSEYAPNVYATVYHCSSIHFSKWFTIVYGQRFYPITLPWENVQIVVGFWCVGLTSKYPNNSARFGRFLRAGLSDWTDSFCIESCFLRHKFRLPTTYYHENFKIPVFFRLTPFGGPPKVILDENKLFPNVLLYIDHHIRYLL